MPDWPRPAPGLPFGAPMASGFVPCRCFWLCLLPAIRLRMSESEGFPVCDLKAPGFGLSFGPVYPRLDDFGGAGVSFFPLGTSPATFDWPWPPAGLPLGVPIVSGFASCRARFSRLPPAIRLRISDIEGFPAAGLDAGGGAAFFVWTFGAAGVGLDAFGGAGVGLDARGAAGLGFAFA